MNNRRTFLKRLTTASSLGVLGLGAAHGEVTTPAASASKVNSGSEDRAEWLGVLERVAMPVLQHLARRELRQRMPVETNGNVAERRSSTHLEAFARTLVGIAPWLEVRDLTGEELQLQKKIVAFMPTCMDAATNPASPDCLNFNQGGQPLVDTAFLAQAILRAPKILWSSLAQPLRQQLITALKSSRVIKPPNNNWLLFAALVETALLEVGEPALEERLEENLRRLLAWYVGDGVYGDGARFHFDYYNSFVIHPALVDILNVLRRRDKKFEPVYQVVLTRARRYAEIQERLIAPDGSFPAVGRSLVYRIGAFQALGQVALLGQLPGAIKPAQVRCALTAVLRRMMTAPKTYDAQGWLRVGFCGHQPALGEPYISTGSLYLCTVGLLPLGLAPQNPFWSEPAAPWTAQRVWAGESLPADHALSDKETVEVPHR
jgi:hypothetical protein